MEYARTGVPDAGDRPVFEIARGMNGGRGGGTLALAVGAAVGGVGGGAIGVHLGLGAPPVRGVLGEPKIGLLIGRVIDRSRSRGVKGGTAGAAG